RVIWGKRNRIGGTLALKGDVHDVIEGTTVANDIGDVAATGTFNYIVYRAARPCRIARAHMVTTANVAASGSNYRSLLWRRLRAGTAATIASPHTQAGWTAWIPVSAGVS